MIGLYLGAAVEAGQPVDHLEAGIGAAGVLEVSPPGESGVGEGGELRAGEFDVEGLQRGFRLGIHTVEFARSGGPEPPVVLTGGANGFRRVRAR